MGELNKNVYGGAPAEEVTIFLHVQAIKQSDGTFEPSASAVKQEGRRFAQLVLEQEDRLEAQTAEEAVLLGRKSAFTALKEKYPQADIQIKK